MTAAVLALAAAAGQMTGCGTASSSGETAAGETAAEERTESAGTVEEMIAQAGSWFSGFIRSGSSPAAGGFIPSLLGQEWITLVVWLLALLILLLLAFRRFCRSTQLP